MKTNTPNNLRSNKWTFLIYQDSTPENYRAILDELQIPYMLSPWHDKDISNETGKLLKPHKHGILFFETLKSYNQVSTIVSENLNAHKHVQVVHSASGTYNYLTHAQNPDKTPYDTNDIEFGAGFELEKFLKEEKEKAKEHLLINVLETIERENFKEFFEIVEYARHNDYKLLELVFNKTFFFSKYLDSRRYRKSETHK